MTELVRPDPDTLLAAVQKEEHQQHRGRLKIFFGMVAGVGKTYAMLQAAHARLKEGADVMIGYVETHARAETDQLTQGLPSFPRAQLEYRGMHLEEMDLDGLLARHPQLVLVDELAHTNVPGSRHIKRYQDVLELIDHGIDVYTTLNVQHIESRLDVVQKITKVIIQETVPDSILEIADEIELIDLSPEDLLKRLNEGKIYQGERALRAAQNFFIQGNLTALREMALRLTAQRVDQQLNDYAEVKQLSGPWKSGERLMVAVSEAPNTESLIRWTRRMAYSLEVPWVAAYVKTSRPLSPPEEQRLSRHLALAQELGGEVAMTSDENIVQGLLRLARQHNITQMVIGPSPHLPWWKSVFHPSIMKALTNAESGLDFCIVSGNPASIRARPLKLNHYFISGWPSYLWCIASIFLMVFVNFLAQPWIGYRGVALILLATVSGLALFFGRGPVMAAATVSAMLWNFLFLPPKFTLYINSLEDWLLFFMYFVVAIVTGHLTTGLRKRERMMLQNEERTAVLYSLSKAGATAVTLDDVLQSAIRQISQVFEAEVSILLSDASGHLINQPHPASTMVFKFWSLEGFMQSQPAETLILPEKEFGVANWVFKNTKPAGKFTETLPLAEAYYLPLASARGVFGVLGIRRAVPISHEQELLLEALVGQLALVVERTRLTEMAAQSQILMESERLYKTLLNSISHELRTPLVTISGATASLLDVRISRHEEVRQGLVQEIQKATERLQRVVENFLDMTRLESGHLKPRLEWCDVADLVSVALKRTAMQLQYHRVQIEIAENLPLVRLDFVLMEQVLINLLDNAALYTPPGTRVEIHAQIDKGELQLSVNDQGPGVKAEEIERLFEKFYRGANAPPGGTGLGLSICKGLVEAQGGTLSAKAQNPQGLSLIVHLPAQIPPPPAEESTL